MGDAEKCFGDIGGFLIESGDRKVLIDTGFGPRHVEFPGFGPFDGGRLLDSLAEAVVEPTQIDTLLIPVRELRARLVGGSVGESLRASVEAWRVAQQIESVEPLRRVYLPAVI